MPHGSGTSSFKNAADPPTRRDKGYDASSPLDDLNPRGRVEERRMTVRRFLISTTVIILVVGAVFLMGYWPERAKRVALEGEVATLRGQLDEAGARVRMGRLLGDLLVVIEATNALNYGQAQGLSSKFFDGVRLEADRTPVPSFKTTLEGILRNRDGVTAALTRGDAAALETLRSSERQLREALSYPLSPPS
jgi:hypothetical protein